MLHRSATERGAQIAKGKGTERAKKGGRHVAMAALSLGRKRPRRARQWIAHFNRRQNYAYGGLDYTLE
jgi:hypothetical protein